MEKIGIIKVDIGYLWDAGLVHPIGRKVEK
jgi:hypothetical protein